MSQVTTHVLDTSAGKPAKGIRIVMEEKSSSGWRNIASGTTNDDGRIASLLSDEKKLSKGIYRMTFETKSYFDAQQKKGFYPQVCIEFEITDDSHYHIPLLLSPYGYSTYRGS